MTRVLKIGAYRRLLAAYTLNELAFMVGALALALLVYRRTGSALGAAAFFLTAQFVPALISPMAVARLDHRPLRPVLPALYWFEAVVFFALAWVAMPFRADRRCWRSRSWMESLRSPRDRWRVPPRSA